MRDRGPWVALGLIALFVYIKRAVASTPHTFLTFDAIRGVAQSAGFPKEHLDVAAAIAMAESAGEVENDRGDNGTSLGLWQIHTPAWPQFKREQLLTARGNAQAAYEIYSKVGGFGAWSTYTNGTYQKYLPNPDAGGGGSDF